MERNDHGDQLVGYVRLQESEAKTIIQVSGACGIFSSLQQKCDVKPDLFWIKRNENETDENYARRCLGLSKERKQPCILRNGGGNDIGFSKKTSDQPDVEFRVVDAMGFNHKWDEQDVKTLVEAVGWKDVNILSRKKIFGSFSWRLRGIPPPETKKQTSWSYEIPENSFDGRGDWTLNVLCAPPRIRSTQVEPIRGPKRQFRDDTELTPQTLSIPSKGKGRAEQDKPNNRDRSRSPKKNNGSEVSATRGTEGTKEQDQMDTTEEKVPPTAIDSQPSQTSHTGHGTPDDLVTHQGWTMVDQGGAGDCFFRALADSWHWTCKNTKIDSTKATHEGAWLRSQACQHIIKHKERFVNFYAVQKKATTKSFETWVAEAAQSTTWTDGLLIQALTEKIGCVTIVWRRTASHWERFCFAPKFHNGEARYGSKGAPLCVILKDKHYLSLRPPESNTKVIPKEWLHETPGHFRASLSGAGPSVRSRQSSQGSCMTPSVRSNSSGSQGCDVESIATPSVKTIATHSGKDFAKSSDKSDAQYGVAPSIATPSVRSGTKRSCKTDTGTERHKKKVEPSVWLHLLCTPRKLTWPHLQFEPTVLPQVVVEKSFDSLLNNMSFMILVLFLPTPILTFPAMTWDLKAPFVILDPADIIENALLIGLVPSVKRI